MLKNKSGVTSQKRVSIMVKMYIFWEKSFPYVNVSYYYILSVPFFVFGSNFIIHNCFLSELEVAKSLSHH